MENTSSDAPNRGNHKTAGHRNGSIETLGGEVGEVALLHKKDQENNDQLI